MLYANTEFYYCLPDEIEGDEIRLGKDESKHLILVMRRSIGDKLFVTNGMGNLFKAEILTSSKDNVRLKILKKTSFNSKFPNIKFYLPMLKSADRLEMAIEKCVELGFTKFAIYSAAKSPKRNFKLSRYNKIALAAMKQSLQTFKADIQISSLEDMRDETGSKTIVFDQLSKDKFVNYFSSKNISHNSTSKFNLIFGPEAGLTEKEIEQIPDLIKLSLTDNRLRAETAIISAASLISLNFTH